MQLITALAPLALSTIVAAWNVDLYGTDGRHVNFHGRKNSGCVDISFTPAISVKQADFNPATSFLPDPDSFELYVRKGCDGLSYRNGQGNHNLTPARVIRSYKVTGSLLGRVKRMGDIEESGIEFDALEDIFKRNAEVEEAPEPEPEAVAEPEEDETEGPVDDDIEA